MGDPIFIASFPILIIMFFGTEEYQNLESGLMFLKA
jgi:hypothetical protein